MTTRLALALMASFGVVVSAQQAAPQQEQTYRPGPGIENPVPLRNVQPKYTREAMQARVQGVVELEAVILPNGNVGTVRIVRSLDSKLGLDDEAVAAARQWLFKPGTLKDTGRPVPVIVTIILEFRLHTSPTPPPTSQGLQPVKVIAGDDFYKDAYPVGYLGLVAPVARQSAQPKYTSDAMRAKIQGIVEVELVIGVNGAVDRARVATSLDRQFGLDDSAIEAARQWIFEPGLLNGSPVPVAAKLTLEFRLH